MLASIRPAFYLLAIPVGSMGVVQLVFSLLSLLLFRDKQVNAFFLPSVLMLITAIILHGQSKKFDFSKITPRSSLLFATLSWCVMGLLGSIPIIIVTHVSLTDGIFESVSALTTTGATILTGLDEMPHSFLLFRQFLQWLGGLGIVIFVVEVLPLLNVGGMQLLKAETPGPIKDDKLAPRIKNTARYLWYIYVGSTVLCAIGYYFAGMTSFDAIAHSLTTISTGGFSTHDASFGFFQNHLIELNANIFMLIGAIAFGVHFQFIRTLNPSVYTKDEETKTFIYIIIALSIMMFFFLWNGHVHNSVLKDFNQSVFHVISFITTTGYADDSFTSWPIATALLLVIAGYLGGCAGSTAGGNKIIRNIISFKLIRLQLNKLIHPRGSFQVKYNGRRVEANVLTATMSFMSISAFMSISITFAVMLTGLDFWTSLTAVSSCLNVLGPAFGELGNNFQPATDSATWMFTFAMILGRLEYFSVLILFTKGYWRM